MMIMLSPYFLCINYLLPKNAQRSGYLQENQFFQTHQAPCHAMHPKPPTRESRHALELWSSDSTHAQVAGTTTSFLAWRISHRPSHW